MKQKHKSPEHDMQVACINWFRLQYPSLKDNLFAIPNGGDRNLITATRLKAEGVLKGVPDLFLAKPNSMHSGMFIEMKVKPNKPTKEQVILMNYYSECGYRCALIYSFEDFTKLINEYLDEFNNKR